MSGGRQAVLAGQMGDRQKRLWQEGWVEAGRRLEQEARRRWERTQEAGKREEGWKEGGGQAPGGGGGWRAGRSAEGRRRVEIGGGRQGRRLEAVEGGKGLERAGRSAGSQRREEGGGWRQEARGKGAGWSAGWRLERGWNEPARQEER